MAKLTEIRWHGRGGQGAKTAATLLAEAALHEGKYSQGFPEYGPERMGAPMCGYTRISDEPIRIHCAVYHPDIVVILDDSLLDAVDVCEGLSPEGAIIVNTTMAPDRIREKTGFAGKIATINATQISIDELGRPIPNTVMIGALLRSTGVLKKETVLEDLEAKFRKKFPERVIQGNLKAIGRAFEETVIAESGKTDGRPRREAKIEVKKGWQDVPIGGLIEDAGNAQDYETGDWKTFRPVRDEEKCTNCLLCWIHCPDSAIMVEDGKVVGIDLLHCKGCGLCAVICPPKVHAIEMELDTQK